MAMFHSFEKIDAWQKARQLVKELYAISAAGKFARDLVLRDQIRRAAVSIASNIAEGFGRGGNAEFIQFLSVAKGSAEEVRAQLYLALDQTYIDPGQFEQLQGLVTEISGKIGGLIAYLRKSGMKGSKFKQRGT